MTAKKIALLEFALTKGEDALILMRDSCNGAWIFAYLGRFSSCERQMRVDFVMFAVFFRLDTALIAVTKRCSLINVEYRYAFFRNISSIFL